MPSHVRLFFFFFSFSASLLWSFWTQRPPTPQATHAGWRGWSCCSSVVCLYHTMLAVLCHWYGVTRGIYCSQLFSCLFHNNKSSQGACQACSRGGESVKAGQSTEAAHLMDLSEHISPPSLMQLEFRYFERLLFLLPFPLFFVAFGLLWAQQ